MSAIKGTSAEEAYYWDCSENNLSQLEKFKVLFHMPNAKVEEIWQQYQLLPKQDSYLIASHYGYTWGWSLKTKDRLVLELKQALMAEKERPKIAAAIDSAVVVQGKLIVLEKLYQALKNSRSKEKRIRVFEVLKQEHPALYKETMDKIEDEFYCNPPPTIGGNLDSIGVEKFHTLSSHKNEVLSLIRDYENGCPHANILNFRQILMMRIAMLGVCAFVLSRLSGPSSDRT